MNPEMALVYACVIIHTKHGAYDDLAGNYAGEQVKGCPEVSAYCLVG